MRGVGSSVWGIGPSRRAGLAGCSSTSNLHHCRPPLLSPHPAAHAHPWPQTGTGPRQCTFQRQSSCPGAGGRGLVGQGASRAHACSMRCVGVGARGGGCYLAARQCWALQLSPQQNLSIPHKHVSYSLTWLVFLYPGSRPAREMQATCTFTERATKGNCAAGRQAEV